MDYSKLKLMLTDVDGVRMVHSLHIWSLNVDKHCMTAHLAIGKNIYEFLSKYNRHFLVTKQCHELRWPMYTSYRNIG